MDAAEELLKKLFVEGQGNVESQNSGAALALSSPAHFTTTVVTLNNSATLTLPAPQAAGERKKIAVKQDGSGNHTLTWASAAGSITWLGGTAPVMPSGAGTEIFVEFVSLDGTNWTGYLVRRPAEAITGALSTVADAPTKAVLTSVIAALVRAGLATDGTT